MKGFTLGQNFSVRQEIADAVTSAHVLSPEGSNAVSRFVSDRVDYSLKDLGLDSLGLMEFTIALELNIGCEITPEQAVELGSLVKILDFIEATE